MCVLEASYYMQQNLLCCPCKHTSLGAIIEANVMVFSSGKSVFPIAMMTTQSPEGTAFTRPLNHAVVPEFEVAILETKP
jgi:hypothetical protein